MVKKTDAFTEEQLDRILHSGKATDTRFGRKPILPEADQQELLAKTFFYLCPRVSEIVGPDGLTPSRIDYDRGLVTLRNLKSKLLKRNCAKCGDSMKTGRNTCSCGSQEIIEVPRKPRYKEVEAPQHYLDELKAYIQRQNIGLDQVIFSMSRSTANRIVKRLCLEAGITKMGFRKPHVHNFRHTYITLAKTAGASDKFLQDQAGHSSYAMLGEYIDVKEGKKEVEKIDNFIRKKEIKE